MKQRLFWAVVLLLHAGLWVKQVFLQHSLLQDAHEYLQSAHNLITHGNWYCADYVAPLKPEFFTKRPPGYPCFLAAVEGLCGGQNKVFFALVYLLQNLISIGLIYLLTQWLKPAIQTLTSPYTIISLLPGLALPIYANLIMSETLLSACLFLIVYYSFQTTFTNKHYLLITLLAIAAMLIKPVFMPIAILLPGLWLILGKRPSHKPLYSLALLPLICFFTLLKINQNQTGYAQYSSISQINLLHYNTYSLLIYQQGTHKADSIIDQIRYEAQQNKSYAAQVQYQQKACSQILKSNLLPYTYLHLRGMLLTTIDPGKFDYTQILNIPHEQNGLYHLNDQGINRSLRLYLNPLGTWLILVAISKLILLIWVGIYAFSKKEPLQSKIILVVIPLMVIGLTGPIGASRFLVPLLPIWYALALRGYATIAHSTPAAN